MDLEIALSRPLPRRFLAVSLALALLTMAQPAPAAPPAVGEPAPPFKVTDTAGRKLSLDLQKGDGRVTLFFFWNLRVPSCLRQIEAMEKLNTEWQSRRLTVIGVEAGGAGHGGMAELFEKLAAVKIVPSYSMVADPGRELAALLGADGVPSTLLLDQNGIVRLRLSGFSAEQAAEIGQAVRDIYAPKEAPSVKPPAQPETPVEDAAPAAPSLTPQRQEFEKHRYFGEFHYNRGDYDKAVESFQRCLAIDPADVPVMLRLGEAFAMKKDFVRARETWEAAQRLSPENPEPGDFLRRLMRGDFR